MFLQRDPIGFAAGDLNLYAYTWNDPYNWTDPSGLAVENTALTAGIIGMGMAVTGSAVCAVTEPCRKGLMGAFMNLLGRISDALFNDGIPGDEPETYPDDPPMPDTADCDPVDPKCLEEPGGSSLPEVKKVVRDSHNNPDKQGYAHTVQQGVGRGVWSSENAAHAELKALQQSIRQNGWPRGTIADTAKSGQVLVPAGNNGYVVFRVGSNGTARFITTLIRR